MIDLYIHDTYYEILHMYYCIIKDVVPITLCMFNVPPKQIMYVLKDVNRCA